MTWYTVRKIDNDLYRIVKFDHLLNVEGSYQLAREGPLNRLKCTCPGFHKSRPQRCKHIDIFISFIRENRINTGWFYNYDTEMWDEPLMHPVRSMRRKFMTRGEKS